MLLFVLKVLKASCQIIAFKPFKQFTMAPTKAFSHHLASFLFGCGLDKASKTCHTDGVWHTNMEQMAPSGA